MARAGPIVVASFPREPAAGYYDEAFAALEDLAVLSFAKDDLGGNGAMAGAIMRSAR